MQLLRQSWDSHAPAARRGAVSSGCLRPGWAKARQAIGVVMSTTIGDYLLARLAEMGVRHLFGVPGDFNLLFLESAGKAGRPEFIGCCNELNAAYAADGYARLNGMAALATTYGVGELGALSGV